jgi:hypothetical protein
MQLRSLVRLLCLLVTSFVLLGCEDDQLALPPGFSFDGGVLTFPDGATVIVDAAGIPTDSGRPPVDPIPDAAIDSPAPVDASLDAPIDTGPPPDAGSCTGKPNGASCGNPTSSICDLGDTCLNGECMPNYATAGVSCGNATVSACSEPDTCDGNGACSARNKPAGAPCGNATTTACTQPDTCDGNGTCLANNSLNGTSCGDPGASQCDSPDSCLNGVCLTNVQPNGSPCGNQSADACTNADSCQGGLCVANNNVDGTICGDPTETTCNHADSCIAGACVPNLANDGTACGDPTATTCNGADACLAGTCAPNLAVDGTACGDPTSTTCNGADSCLAGSCAANLAVDGTACGDPTATTCNGADTCLAGACAPNVAIDGTACGDPTTGECTLPDTCLAGGCAPNNATAGIPCGNKAATDCSGSDTCDANGVCQLNNMSAGTACYDCASGGGLCSACNTSGACNEAAACTTAPIALLSPPVNGNSLRGNMFDVVATNSIVVTGFEGNIFGANPTTYEIYYRLGTYVGHESSASGWIKAFGPSPVTHNGEGNLTPITSTLEIAIPAGATYGFFLTNTIATASNSYHDGEAVGNVSVSDANVAILEGAGKGYPFDSGSPFTPRVWEGRMTYHLADVLATLSQEVDAADGVMFDVSTTAARRIQAMDVLIGRGEHNLSIYFKRGTHVGFTGSQFWEFIGGAAVASTGFVRVPFPVEVHVPANSTAAFYVTTTNAAAVGYGTGTAVGAPAATSGPMTLHEGVSVAGSFGTTTGPRVFQGRVYADVCQ